MNQAFLRVLFGAAPLVLAACAAAPAKPPAAPLARAEAITAPLVPVPPPEPAQARADASGPSVVYPYNLPQYNDLDAEITKATPASP